MKEKRKKEKMDFAGAPTPGDSGIGPLGTALLECT